MDRSAWYWLGGLTVLIVVAVVLATWRHPTRFPEDTPEGVVQRYLDAVFEGDAAAATEWWSAELAGTDCSRLLRDELRFSASSFDRAVLDEVDVDDGRAEVIVVLSPAADPFAGTYEHPATFVLERTDRGWRIVEPPWPVEWCALEPPAEG
ncbi:MAG TPA: hypothetical protein ENK55_10050 [Actinobacteria bacterium]|nr:hypothetical protein [Actinomycetota bacterium]